MTYPSPACATRPPGCRLVECRAAPDLGRVWNVFWSPSDRCYRVERDGEWCDDFDGLAAARAAITADVRAFRED